MGGRRNRWARALRAVAIVIAAVVAAPIVSSPPPAAASGHQWLSWNEDGAGFRTFGPNASVTIYDGTGTPGTCDGFFPYTDIFVVSESSLSDNETLTDVSNAQGLPNTVALASGGYFGGETIGFTVPSGRLGAGTYGVVYDECQDGKFDADVDKLFYPAFRVEIDPANIPPLDPAIQALKDSAQAQADSWQYLVDAVEAIELLLELKEYYECLSGGLAGCAISMLSDALQDYLKDKVMEQLGVTDPQEAAKQVVLSTIKHYGGIAADPPDPNFEQSTVLTPRTEITPDRDDPIADAIVGIGNSQADEAALAEALLHAMERYQGADAAGHGTWALVHARQIQSLADDLGSQLVDSDASLAALDAVLAAETRDLDDTAVGAEAERARIEADGFSEDELAFLANHGVSAADRAALRDKISETSLVDFAISNVRARISTQRARISSLSSTLTTLETTMQGYVNGLEADPGTFDIVPVAKAGGPYSATEGVAVALNGSASTDDGTISGYAWDTDGDGQFDDATGATPSVTFPSAGVFTISLRVTDTTNMAGVDSAVVTVAEANGAPAITSTTPAGPQVDIPTGGSQQFTASATDPDGDTVAIQWLLDSAVVGSGPTFTYAPSVANTGMHTLRVQATDGLPAGGTDSREWAVSVLQPDGDGDGWNANADCADNNAAVPGPYELVGNGINDDCDPATPDTGSAPTAAFTRAVQPGLIVNFTNTSTDPNNDLVSRQWDFGDGGSSTAANPTHGYAAKGTYTVTLTVTDATGLSDAETKQVVVASPPAPSFTYAPSAPVEGSEVIFTDTSTDPDGTVVAWAWDFGDGDTSSQQHPTHEFTDTGTYTVSLEVTDDDGATAATTQQIVVGVANPSTAPVAAFRANLTPRDVAALVNGGSVVASSGYCCGGHEAFQMLDDSVGWPWATTNASVGHYATIQVATSARLIDSVQIQPRSDGWPEQRVRDFAIDVSTTGFAAADFVNVLNATAADNGNLQTFALPPGTTAKYVRYRPINNRGGCCNISTSKFKVITAWSGSRTASFVNESVNATSYKWTFGDGGTSTQATPTHTYATIGTYTVTLTARAEDGRTNTYSHVYEARGPTTDFAVDPATPIPGQPAVFTDTSLYPLSPGTTFAWTFGDGTMSTASGTLHTFETAGTYNVTYRVTDAEGNTDEMTKAIAVTAASSSAPPTARFAPTSGGVNVANSALGASIHSFSTQYSVSYPPGTILDENAANSYWATANTIKNGWAKIDLAGDRHQVDRIRIAGDGGTERVRDFKVSVSATGAADADFTEVLSATNPNDDNLREYIFPGGPVTARYVRIDLLNNHGHSCCVAIDRFDVLTGAAVNVGRNLASAPTGASIVSSSGEWSSAYPAASIIDGNPANNYWATPNGVRSGWVKIDLAGTAPRMIDRIQIQPNTNNAEKVKEFEIAVSTTGTDHDDFVTVGGATLHDNTNLTDVLLPYPMPATYVMYRPMSNQGATCCVSTNQLRVYTGQESASRTVTFKNLSHGATSYAWDFGDGVVSTAPAPTHTFPGPGTYTVTLTATNANGSSTFVLEQVIRTADFSYTPSAPEAQQQIDFVNASPAELGLVSVSWDFGDGTTSAWPNPLKTYPSPGVYTVTMTGVDRDGNTRVAQEAVTVATPAFRALFHPRGTSNVASLENGATVVAFSSQYHDSNWWAPKLLDYSTATSWHSSASPAQNTKWIKFSLAGGQTYQVDRFQLLGRQDCCPDQQPADFEIAVSTTGTADADFKTVLRSTLPANVTSPYTFMLPRPVAAKYVLYRTLTNRGSGVVTTAALRAASGQASGLTVTFDDLTLGGTGPLSYAWNFGDGGTSDQASPTHTFPAPGLYNVTLTVTDATGATSTHSLQQRVLTPLAPTFSNAPLTPNEAQATTFTDTTPAPASGPIVERRWTWGDGTAATVTADASTSHTFADNGVYDVTLEIRDAWGQVATVTRQITVNNVSPTVNAGVDWRWREDRALTSSATTFDVAGARDPVTCVWSYGDGTSDGTGCSFSHTYSTPGTYTAMVTASDGDGGTAVDSFVVEVIEQELPAGSGGSGGGGGTGAGKASKRYTYTVDDDFELGTMLNVNHQAPGSNQLQLNKEAKPFPFVYIAASGRGTALRIDVNTGEIVGEYRTAPENRAKNPSRTTVDKLGNVWVTNRDESETRTIGGVNTSWGSATRIGLLVGGTRSNADGTPNPLGEYMKAPFEYNTCVDRNSDGLIRTSRGRGNILGWANTSGVDHDGGADTALDECIQLYVRVRGVNTRTVAIDAENDAWIGGANSWHEEVDGDTGIPVPGTAFSLGCGGYGGLIDRNGILWSARYNNGLLRYNTLTKTGVCLGNGHGDYGLGVDPVAGNIWHTMLNGNGVVKLNPAATTAGTIEISRHTHGNQDAQGVTVDAKGSVWVSHALYSAPTIGRVRTDGLYLGKPSLGPNSAGSTGVAVDGNGKVWSANYITNNVSRIDPEIGQRIAGSVPSGWYDMNVDLGSGASPYNYSDMTGTVAIGSASPSGFWSIKQDSEVDGTIWKTISWDGSTPGGTSITVEARAADEQTDLPSTPFLAVTDGGQLSGVVGRYIEVRTTLQTSDPAATPILTDITISANTPPTAADVIVSTDKDTPVDVDFSASDLDGDTLTYTHTNPAHGTFNGTTYTPAAGYTGPDSFTYTATDPAGDSATANVSITVNSVNDPPSANAGGPYTLDEGATVTLDGSLSTDPDNDELVYAWDLDNDGFYDDAVGATPSVSYDDGPAAFTVGLRVTDTGGLTSTATSTVTVRNLAPAATLSSPVSAPEGSSFTVALTGPSDPSTADTVSGFTYAFDCGNGYGSFGASASVSCPGADDDGSVPVGAKVRDKDGGETEYTAMVTVTNVSPGATLLAPETVAEGGSFSLSLTAPSDPSGADLAGLEYAFDCGTGYGDFGSSNSTSCSTAVDDATLSVRARVRDDDGGAAEYTDSVSVTNVAPSGTFAATTPITEGSTSTLSWSSITDPSALDTFRYSFACNGSLASLATTYASASPDSSTTCSFTDDGVHTVAGRVFDDDGGSIDATFDVTVTNVAPIATLEAPVSVPEGDSFTLTMTDPSDPSLPDLLELQYAFDCGSGYGPFGYSSAVSCSTAVDDGTLTVRATVRDDDGGSTEYTDTVAVTNVAPTGSLTASSPVDEGSSSTVSWSSVADASALDTFRFSFACDGLTASLAGSYAAASTSSSTTCAFADNGLYVIRGRLFDDDGGSLDATVNVTVDNVAPSADFVAPVSAAEGDQFVLSMMNGSDPSPADMVAGLQYQFDCGDGYGAFGSSTSVSCSTADDDGVLSVRATVRDKDGATTEYSDAVQVTNVAPTATANSDSPAPWGATVNLSASGSDVSAADDLVLTYEWDTNGDGTYDTAASTTPGHSTSYADPGTYTARVRVCDDDGGCVTATTPVSVLAHGTSLVYDGANSAVYSDPVSLSATLTDTVTGLPVSGATVGFTFAGQTPSDATDSAGNATSSLVVSSPAGTLPVAAAFSGTSHYTASGDTDTISIAREDAQVEYSGDTFVTGTSARLAATVTEDADGSLGDITKAAVTFDVYTGATACGSGTPIRYGPVPVVDSGTTGDGVGTAEFVMTTAGEQTYCIVARLTSATTTTAPNAYYTATPTQAAVLTVVSTTGKFATGGGWIIDDDTLGRGNFGFTARFTKSGAPKGSAVYVWRGTYNGQRADFIVKSSAITGLSFADLNGNGTFPWRATLDGKATLRINRASDGTELLTDGNATFRMVGVDSGESSGRGADTFAIRVLDKNGRAVKEVGTWAQGNWSAGIPLSGGNEVVHM